MQNTWTDKQVEKFWNSVADIYIRENQKVDQAHNQRFHQTLELLDLKKNQKILNISSRDSGLYPFIKKACPSCQLVNAEISSKLISQAKRLYPKAKQVKISTYSQLPLEDQSFDVIVSLETLEHVSRPLEFLKQLHRVAKDDATLVLSCPPATAEIPYRVYTFFYGGHGEGPHRFLTSRQVKDLLEKSGWKLISHKGTLLLPLGPTVIKSLAEKIIKRFQNTFISELGIRQFYVCKK